MFSFILLQHLYYCNWNDPAIKYFVRVAIEQQEPARSLDHLFHFIYFNLFWGFISVLFHVVRADLVCPVFEPIEEWSRD